MNISTDVIVTYDKKDQEFFQTNMEIDKNLSEYGLEKEWVTHIVKQVSHPTQLTKLSLCILNYEKIEKEPMRKGISSTSDKLEKILDNKNGKYYFQPDQRDDIVNQIIRENPNIAQFTRSMKQCYLDDGLDPIQESFNHMFITGCNSKFIDEFKKKYTVLIKRTFGDVIKNDLDDELLQWNADE